MLFRPLNESDRDNLILADDPDFLGISGSLPFNIRGTNFEATPKLFRTGPFGYFMTLCTPYNHDGFFKHIEADLPRCRETFLKKVWPKISEEGRLTKLFAEELGKELQEYSKVADRFTPEQYYKNSANLKHNINLNTFLDHVDWCPDGVRMIELAKYVSTDQELAFQQYMDQSSEYVGYCIEWTLKELDKIQPGLSDSISAQRVYETLTTDSDYRKSCAKYYEKYAFFFNINKLYPVLMMEVFVRVVLPRLIPEMYFYTEEKKDRFMKIWNDYKADRSRIEPFLNAFILESSR